MDIILQRILLIFSLIFFVYIFLSVKDRKLQYKHALIWMSISYALIILVLFPDGLNIISRTLKIKEPVNAIVMLLIMCLLLIIFSLSLTLSSTSENLKNVVQELGLIKLRLEKVEVEKDKINTELPTIDKE